MNKSISEITVQDFIRLWISCLIISIIGSIVAYYFARTEIRYVLSILLAIVSIVLLIVNLRAYLILLQVKRNILNQENQKGYVESHKVYSMHYFRIVIRDTKNNLYMTRAFYREYQTEELQGKIVEFVIDNRGNCIITNHKRNINRMWIPHHQNKLSITT